MRNFLILFGLCGCVTAPSPPPMQAPTEVTQSAPPKRVYPAPPKVPKEAVVDEMHGHEITDPYRWLEKEDSEQVEQFDTEQNGYTKNLLEQPGRTEIEERLTELLSIGVLDAPTPRYPKGKDGRYFYTRRDGKQNQPVLYVRDGLGGEDRVLIDPNAMSEDGTTALDWWDASHNGQLLAYGISHGGTEMSTLRVRNVDTGRDLGDVIENTRWASVVWEPKGKGFYYSRYPAKGSVPDGEEQYHRAVYHHALGAKPEDDQLIYKPSDMKDWPYALLSPDGRWLTVSSYQGWSRSEVYVRDLQKEGSKLKPVALGIDAIFDVTPLDDRLLIRTNEGGHSRYRLMSVNPKRPRKASWKEVIPEGQDVLDETAVIGGKIFATYVVDAANRVRTFSLEGKALDAVELPALGRVQGIKGEPDGPEAFIGFSSFAVPPTVLRHALGGGATTIWSRVEAPIDPDEYGVQQVRFKSTDGVEVPMFLVYKKPLERNGKNLTLLTGYGGFNVSMTPGFQRNIYLLLERGGVYAVPNLRGGGEYGEAWHKAGMLGKKQQVFDDFIAAAHWLIDNGITNQDRLAISGSSNGGLLVGAALTQAPDLFRVVVCGVPLLDMLRYHHFRLAKLWISEYGDPEDPKAFEWLKAYSPYHKIEEGTDYPAVLFTTAVGDTRVDPMHARKMAARLQAATSSKKPVLLRVESKAGHGAGKPLDLITKELSDEWTFIFWQLGAL